MDDMEKKIQDVYRKIQRENTLIEGSIRMRQGTSNPSVQQALDTKIREGQKNISYLQESLSKLQMSQSSAPPLPPKNDPSSAHDMARLSTLPTPRAPYSQQPGPGIPKTRNYTKLDLIKADTPHTPAKISLMLQQLEFKLTVERQYKEGIEKMLQLYEIEGERRAKSDAKAKQVESQQKLQLLKTALKRYEALHVDIDEEPTGDDDSMSAPNQRKPLSGQLKIGIKAVREADHATTTRFGRSPETFVVVKVEDIVLAKTAKVRTDKWSEEFNLQVDKANEVEITVYDKAGDTPLPIGLLWIRLSDIVDELRRKRIEQEIQASGGEWVSADGLQQGSYQYPGSTAPTMPGRTNTANRITPLGSHPSIPSASGTEAWFALEPAGQIQLSLDFIKDTTGKSPALGGRGGLRRQAAIRQRKEEVHEMYGHKFVQQQFYQIMRCALCAEFLKNATGYQCADCKYTCHKKCYPRVVTKCISKSNAETDPDEAKLNHRIPHRFEPLTNISANWCCHCGYLLPLGKKNARKCSECNLTCHTQCSHLVPDFCGMSMEMANQILATIKQSTNAILSRPPKEKFSMTDNMNGGLSGRPPQSHQQRPVRKQVVSEQSYTGSTQDSEFGRPQSAGRPQQLRLDSNAAAAAAINRTGSYASSSRQSPGSSPITERPSPQSRPSAGPRTTSAAAAAAAAASKALSGATGSQSQRYPPSPSQRTSYQDLRQQRPSQSTASESNLVLPNVPLVSPLLSTNDRRDPIAQQLQSPAQPGNRQQAAPQQQVTSPQQGQPTSQRPRRVGLADFNFIAVLGKGNFGKVMLAEYKATKKLYAIKVLKKDFIIENDEVESTRSEKRVFLVANKERHPFLINLHSCFQTETRVYFVMDYVSGGDLMLHIQKEQFGRQRARFYAAEVCLALKYFHENGIIYRDLKLDNILLGTDGHIKVADYGLCKEEMWAGQTTTTFCGTPEFMAPEILAEQRYGRAVDWWAFGVLIYQMLLGQSPFRGEDEDEIFDAILSDEPLYPIHMPKDSVDILRKLLIREPEKRLGCGPTDALEVMNHPFFADIDWDAIYHKRVKPTYVPTLRDATDTSNFDEEFTKEQPKLTPIKNSGLLTAQMQEQFRGFSCTCD
ncbi:hypothetical protein BCR37DRAFT_412365 [Protomyces lactucae-debilis]|uniref:protein kinase C n=1 Tax=Protomyces lactucae-debilis TaxID=2754530 RepID=A0A1Y2FQS6_PROLT|nr:uncharacterized protein BCR37DRAFT_412365 [Protomyces lactucae-debilis]ORY85674.1 hypothetical protein BCR37DRAFT_412365 [Protomyces lactucae-debilis]